MALYSVSYLREDEQPKIHAIEAASEPAARIRFLNLSWVAFQPITILSIAIASDQPEEAKRKARGAVAAGVKPHTHRSPDGSGPCSECRLPFDAKVHKGKGFIKDDEGGDATAAVRAQSAGLMSPVAASAALVLTTKAGTPERKVAKSAFDRAIDKNWEAEVARLSDEIGDLADKAQAVTRAGDHAAADALRAKAKGLAATRAKITKRNRKK